MLNQFGRCCCLAFLLFHNPAVACVGGKRTHTKKPPLPEGQLLYLKGVLFAPPFHAQVIRQSISFYFHPFSLPLLPGSRFLPLPVLFIYEFARHKTRRETTRRRRNKHSRRLRNSDTRSFIRCGFFTVGLFVDDPCVSTLLDRLLPSAKGVLYSDEQCAAEWSTEPNRKKQGGPRPEATHQ